MAQHSASDTAGLEPGAPVYTGDFKDAGMRVRVIEFDAHTLVEREISDLAEARRCLQSTQTSWIDITGLNNVEAITAFCNAFQIHPLAVEDILNTSTRAKAEEFGRNLLVVAQMVRLSFDAEEHPVLDFEHSSILSGPSFVVTFQERDGDSWDVVRRRLRAGIKRIRTSGPDYLAYALLDAIVDDYAVVVEALGKVAEKMEATLLDTPREVEISEIYVLRRELTELRRAAWPIRDSLNAWRRSEHLDEHTRPFLNDLQDHATQVVEAIDMHRDLVLGMIDLHLSSLSHKMNETMQVLTVIATLFIPLTFLTGLYGMNFDNMPELHTKYGYYFAIGTMVLTFVGGLAWFRRRGLI
ncbi:MAG: magnesium/cobalt transporter CorA [Alphaproteobacteria bacterium]|nr:magnesium/cobalt transporter CorA [Alphaproteobacteria bacterium]